MPAVDSDAGMNIEVAVKVFVKLKPVEDYTCIDSTAKTWDYGVQVAGETPCIHSVLSSVVHCKCNDCPWMWCMLWIRIVIDFTAHRKVGKGPWKL